MKLKLFTLLITTFALNTQGFAANKTNSLKSRTHITSSKKLLKKLKALKAEATGSNLVRVNSQPETLPPDSLQTLFCNDNTSSLTLDEWCVDQKDIESVDFQKLAFCKKQTASSVSEALCFFGDIEPQKVNSCYYETNTTLEEQVCMTNQEDIDDIFDLRIAIEKVVPFEVHLDAVEPISFEFKREQELFEKLKSDAVKQIEELGPFLEELGPVINELINQLIEEDQVHQENNGSTPNNTDVVM